MNTALNSSPQPATPAELPGPAVTAELQHQMDQHAQSVIDTILSHDLDSPAFVGEVATQVRSLGSEVMRSTGDLTNGLLDSKEVDLRGAFRPGQETAIPETLGELRSYLDKYDPARATTRAKILGFIPRGASIESWLVSFDSARSHIKALIDRLERSDRTLEDNSFHLFAQMELTYSNQGEVNKVASQLQAMIRSTEHRIAAEQDPARAEKIKARLLSELTRRYERIMEYSAVAWLSYETLAQLRTSNEEVRNQIQELRDVAVPALTVAAMSMSAMRDMQQVSEGINAIAKTTGNYLEAVATFRAEQAPALAADAQRAVLNLDQVLHSLNSAAALTKQLDTLAATASETQMENVRKIQNGLAALTDGEPA